MIQPWGGNKTRVDQNVIWFAHLDDRFMVEVVRQENVDTHTAMLYIYDHNEGDKLLLAKDMGRPLYGAMYGPDVQDVIRWKDEAVTFIDETIIQERSV